MDDGEKVDDPAPHQRCAYFLPRKHRSCKFAVVPGHVYCGNHLNECTGLGNLLVPCPIDPSHNVSQSKLQAHLKKCTKAKQIDSLHSKPYFSPDANAGSDDDPDLDETDAGLDKGCAVRQNPFGPGRAKRRASYARKLGQAAFENLILRLERAYDDVCIQPSKSIVIPPECDRAMKVAVDGSRPYSEKHAAQYASILGNMARFGLIPHPDPETSAGPCFPTAIDLGAGKGWLSFMLKECWGHAVERILLVDNRGFKNKADKSLRGMDMSRLNIDIKDFSIGSSLMGSNEKWLAMGKHCCGASTDYGLRCCVSSDMQKNMTGLAVAPCCHHRCGWKGYVGKAAMIKWGFSPPEFELISWMTGWALCGHSCEDKGSASSDKEDEGEREEEEQEDDEEVASGAGKRKRGNAEEEEFGGDRKAPGPFIELTRETKQKAGAMAKALIDAGRLEWLKDRGFVTETIVYTQESGENRLILAKPMVQPPTIDSCGLSV